MKHKLELRSTISPTPYFFRRIHFMAASLRAVGLADHEIVVSVGGGEASDNYYRSQPWSNRYPIVWRQVPIQEYARLGYRATNRDRAAHMSRGDYVMVVDADVIFLRDFSELIESLRDAPAICGVMAHGSPFSRPPPLTPAFADRMSAGDNPSVYWSLLGENFGVKSMSLEHQYSGWGFVSTDPQHRFAPAYFNGGMVLGPTRLMEQMFADYAAAEQSVDAVMDTYFRPQLARTLAIYRAGLPYRILPMRYNFPNDRTFDRAYPDEVPAIAILHYLRKDTIHRDEDFTTAEGIRGLPARADLSGSNEQFRKRIAELSETVLAEEAAL